MTWHSCFDDSVFVRVPVVITEREQGMFEQDEWILVALIWKSLSLSLSLSFTDFYTRTHDKNFKNESHKFVRIWFQSPKLNEDLNRTKKNEDEKTFKNIRKFWDNCERQFIVLGEKEFLFLLKGIITKIPVFSLQGERTREKKTYSFFWTFLFSFLLGSFFHCKSS